MEGWMGKCDGCGCEEWLASLEGHVSDVPGEFCEDCWHARREATPCYHVRSQSEPRCYSHAAWIPSAYTLLEAEARAVEMNKPGGGSRSDFAPVPVDSWRGGGRLAHPGYMSRRRAEILGRQKSDV